MPTGYLPSSVSAMTLRPVVVVVVVVVTPMRLRILSWLVWGQPCLSW